MGLNFVMMGALAPILVIGVQLMRMGTRRALPRDWVVALNDHGGLMPPS
jgi:hypothetical protein